MRFAIVLMVSSSLALGLFCAMFGLVGNEITVVAFCAAVMCVSGYLLGLAIEKKYGRKD